VVAVHRSIVFGTEAFDALIPVAQAADATGFHRLWTTEYTSRDAILRAVMLANATERINVASGIAYAFSRAPLAMAAYAADAFMMTKGRFALGIGAGTRGMRTRWYQSEFDHPAPRLAEYVDLLRASWAAEKGLHFEGRFYNLDIPAFSAGHDPTALAGLEVYGSGVNAIMLKYAAQSCDGVGMHPIAAAPGVLEAQSMSAIEEGRRRGDRSDGKLAIWLITSLDEDEATARTRAKASLAFYFSTPSYAGIVAGTEFEDAVTNIRETFREYGTDWKRLVTLVPDAMLDAMVLVGTPRQARERLPEIEARFAKAGADELVFQTVGTGLSDAEVVRNCRSIIDELAPGNPA
jgi:alkanesulfonate monooxygenase SsuD/methylene tetrahydromethanopterin reductase-like flavin-dependent oxidoreductase (luciferase family)